MWTTDQVDKNLQTTSSVGEEESTWGHIARKTN